MLDDPVSRVAAANPVGAAGVGQEVTVVTSIGSQRQLLQPDEYDYEEEEEEGRDAHVVAPRTMSMQFGVMLPFEEAVVFARSLHLTTWKEWHAWCKAGARPHNIPAAPDLAYKRSGWQGFPHFLGVGEYRVAAAAAAAAATAAAAADQKPNGLFRRHRRSSSDAPASRTDREKSVARLSREPFLPFASALAHVRALRFTSWKEWWAWCKTTRPPCIPASPAQTYKRKGWEGWDHWFGNTASERVPTSIGGAVRWPRPHAGGLRFLSFGQALEFVRSLHLADAAAYKDFCGRGGASAAPAAGAGGGAAHTPTGVGADKAARRIDLPLPANPDKLYRHDGWRGWNHWLGLAAADEDGEWIGGRASTTQLLPRCTTARARLLDGLTSRRTVWRELKLKPVGLVEDLRGRRRRRASTRGPGGALDPVSPGAAARVAPNRPVIMLPQASSRPHGRTTTAAAPPRRRAASLV